MNPYEAKQEARRERLVIAAGRASAESVERYNAASKMAEVIPFGQPILVGHHSERRDRNYRSKISSGFKQCGDLLCRTHRHLGGDSDFCPTE